MKTKLFIACSFVLFLLCSCNNRESQKNTPEVPPQVNVCVTSAEQTEMAVTCFISSEKDVPTDGKSRILIELRKELPDNSTQVTIPTSFTYPIAIYEHEKNWFDNHWDTFAKLNTSKAFEDGNMYFCYATIKSLTISSTNKSINGREIGENVANLFITEDYCPSTLYSYPNLEEIILTKEKSIKIKASEIEVLNAVVFTPSLVLESTFSLDEQTWKAVDWQVEIVLEDDIHGERTYTKVIQQGR